MELSERIKAIREEKRIKLNEMALVLGVDVSNYAKIEKKGKKLTLERLEEIAAALKVTLAELLGYENEPNAEESEKLRERIEKIDKENFDLKAEKKMLQKHNEILFKNLDTLQNIVASLMGNVDGIEQFKEIVTGGNPDNEEKFKEAANTIFPDLAKMFNSSDQPYTDNSGKETE